MDTRHDAFGGAAVFCLGMACTIREYANYEDRIPYEHAKDLEEIYWENRTAALSDTAVRLNSLHNHPIRFGPFVRPNAHLICFDYANAVLGALWSSIYPDGIEEFRSVGIAHIKFEQFVNRWPVASQAIRALDLPDGGEICSALQQEAARLANQHEGVDQIRSIVESALRSHLQTTTVPPPTETGQDEAEPTKMKRKGISADEANILVHDWLQMHSKDDPATITRDAIAAATGVSKGAVSYTRMWKMFREKRDAETKRGVREKQLNQKMLAVIPCNYTAMEQEERDEELAELIREHYSDQSTENRRHKSS